MQFNLSDRSKLATCSNEYNFSTDLDSKEIEKIFIEIMLQNKGIGLAANQIGYDKRVFVMGSYTHQDFTPPMALFNPKIIEASDIVTEEQEGCLSFPNLWLKIKRPRWIIGGYYDSDGKYIEERFNGYAAKCFQHELDHLNGICYVDKVSKLKLQLAVKKQRKSR